MTPAATFVPGVTNQLTFAMSLTNNNDPDSNVDVAEVEESDVNNFVVTFRFVDVDISSGATPDFEIQPQTVTVIAGDLTSNLNDSYELALDFHVEVRTCCN